MAQFCTKCGAPLGEGLKFCTGCGATAGGPPAPAAPAPAAPAPVAAAPRPAPAAPVAAAPAAKSGSPVIKIILGVLAAVIFLSLLAVGAGAYIYYTRIKPRVTQIVAQAHATFPTASGTREVRTEPVAPAAPTAPAGPVVDTGVAVYPGATPWGGGNQMTMGGTTIKSQEYTTDDSVDKVLAFYKDKLGQTTMVSQGGGQAVVQVIGANGTTTIAIKPDPSLGKTKVSINIITK